MTKRNTFDQDEELTSSFQLHHFQRVGQFISPYKKKMFYILLVIILANVCGMLAPWFMQIAIDKVIPQKNISLLFILTGVFFLSLLVTAFCMRYRIEKMTEVGQDVLKDMRYAIFSHLQKLPFSYFDTRPHGKILIRVVNYINTLSDLLSNGLINLVSDVLSLVITLLFMFLMDIKLTLYSLIFLPILFVVSIFITSKQRVAYQQLSNKQSNLNAYIHESISGVKITQSFAREERNFAIFKEVNEETRTSWLKAVKIMFSLWPCVQNISMLTMAVLYFVGIKQIGLEVSTGTLIAFIALTNNFWNPVINIGNFYNSLTTATAYMERIFETMDITPEIKDKEMAHSLVEMRGEVAFQQVSFQYEKGGRKILDEMTFHINPGENIALVGETGAGKTTIVNLLSRFYDATSGEVLIDGHNVVDITLESLRTQMGVMLQDTFIFSGTIMENIRYGRLDATDEEVIKVAKTVCADTFIKEMKDGYQTVLEERGSTLSAGQRQLISFARTLLSDPKILILDEATSSIDTKTEELLQRGLQALLKGRTSFVIAHRLSTIKNSTQIFYIKNGQVAEKGTHQELMALQGEYHNLYQSQVDLIKV